jgi:hypothetical protein
MTIISMRPIYAVLATLTLSLHAEQAPPAGGVDNPLFPVSGPLMSFLKGLRPKSNSLAPVGSRSGPFGEGGVLDHLALAQLREPASRAMAGARLSFIARH